MKYPILNGEFDVVDISENTDEERDVIRKNHPDGIFYWRKGYEDGYWYKADAYWKGNLIASGQLEAIKIEIEIWAGECADEEGEEDETGT